MFWNVFSRIIFGNCVPEKTLRNKDELDGVFNHFTCLMGVQ